MRSRAILGRGDSGNSGLELSALNLTLKILNAAPLRGRTYLGQLAARRLHASGTLSIVTSDGSQLLLPAEVSQSWNPAVTGVYDPAEIRLLSYFARPGTVVVDVGACFGLYSVPLARTGKRRGFSVVAIEPVTTNVKILKRNLRVNGLADEVVVHAVAGGDSTVDALIDIESEGSGNAAVRTAATAHHSNLSSTEAIKVARLDDLLQGVQVSCMKIDVEGLEMAVLAGASRVVKQGRPTILGEFEPYQLRRRGVDPRDILSWSSKHGYIPLAIRTRHVRPWSDRLAIRSELIDSAGKYDWATCMLLPEERESELTEGMRFANDSFKVASKA